MTNTQLFSSFTEEDKNYEFNLSHFEYEEDEGYVTVYPTDYCLPSNTVVTMTDEGDLDHGLSVYASNSFTELEIEKINYYIAQEEVISFTLNEIISYFSK